MCMGLGEGSMRKATRKEIEEWEKSDYWNRMEFNPMVMFVVLPTIVQILALSLLAGAIQLNKYFLG